MRSVGGRWAGREPAEQRSAGRRPRPTLEVQMATDRWEAAERMLGHKITSKSRKHGTVTHHWVECSCGYASSPGKSARFAIGSGLGHVRRVAERLRGEGLVSSGEIETRLRRVTAGGNVEPVEPN